jgi:hypothetical protein
LVRMCSGCRFFRCRAEARLMDDIHVKFTIPQRPAKAEAYWPPSGNGRRLYVLRVDGCGQPYRVAA